jgi:iron complex transport system substrate-binding protein
MRSLTLFLLFGLSLWANERIVALSPAVSEILFALEKGSSVVGVSAYADYPEAVKEIAKVGGYFQPELEKIVALDPTLVIGQQHHRKLLSNLRRLGIATETLKLDSLSHIKEAIRRLGDMTGARTKAEKLVRAIDKAAADAPKSKSAPRVLIVFGLSEDLRDGIYAAGHDLYFEEIIRICGGENAYSSAYAGQPVLNYEGVIALNPDRVILLHSRQTQGEVDPQEVKALWKSLPIAAARTGKVDVLDAPYLSIPSHRVALAIGNLCRVIAND